MRKLSFWAKCNVRTARLLIVISEILLFILAAKLGLLLLHAGIRLPGITVLIPISLFGTAIVVSHYKKLFRTQSRQTYRQQRLSYILIGLSMFLLTTFMVGSEKLLTWNTYPPASGGKVSLLMNPRSPVGSTLSAKQTKKAARLLRKMRKHDGLKYLYIALIIVGAVALFLFLAAVACSISCNGNEVLAWVVLLLGVAGIVLLCVSLIKKILKKTSPEGKQHSHKKEPATTQNNLFPLQSVEI